MNASLMTRIDTVLEAPLDSAPQGFSAVRHPRRRRQGRRSSGAHVVQHPAAASAAAEPSIEEIIARYVDANPPQLYRGGA
jgi:hypothetical protein